MSDVPSGRFLTATQVTTALEGARAVSGDFYNATLTALHADNYTIPESHAANLAGALASAEAKGAPQSVITDREARTAQWSRMSNEQAASAIDALIEAGVPKEKVLAAAKADGFDVGNLREDKRSEELRAWDKTILGEATRPGQFEIAWWERPVEHSDDLAAALGLHVLDKAGFQPALDRQLRNGLLAMQFPAMAGGALAEYGVDGMRAYAAMSDAQKQTWEKQQTHDLQNATGDAASVQLDARLMIEQWQRIVPKVVEALAKAGFFKSAKVQMELHHQAGRLYHRAELATSKT